VRSVTARGAGRRRVRGVAPPGPRAFWACVVVAATLLGAPPARAQQAPCAPAGGLQTADTARKAGEVTEYFPAGVYRVTRCAPDGTVERSQTVAPVDTPGNTRQRLPIGDYQPDRGFTAAVYPDPGDATWRATWKQARVRLDVLPPTEERAATPARGGTASCANREYHFEGPRLAGGRYAYEARVASMPHGAKDRRAITKGHHTWDRTRNDCGLPDVTSIKTTYRGTTKTTPHTYADGVNVIDFGDPAKLGCAPGTLACTHWNWDGANFFTDIDQRYGAEYEWSTTGAKGRYDLWSVAAHESGHALGLAHANSSSWLTMYYQASLGCTKWRTLAAGDALGLRCRYASC